MNAKGRKLAVAAAIIAGLVIVGTLEKRDAEMSSRQYCDNVKQGVWPDYRGTFKEQCGGKEPPQFHPNLAK